MNKKGVSGFNIFIGVVLTAMLVGGGFLGWAVYTGKIGGAEEQTGINIQSSNTGGAASLKVLSYVNDPSVTQFAGTGYVWETNDPASLIDSVSGKTLSASAGTAFSPATIGKSYTATAFDSTHWCETESLALSVEADQIKLDCVNVSSGNAGFKPTFYERGTAETSNSLTIIAGSMNSFDRLFLETNQSYVRFPLKAICFGSNASTSHISNLVVGGGFVASDSPSSSYDYCYALPSYNMIENGGEEIVAPISVYADSTGFGTDELITVTFMDECKYVSKDASHPGVQTDYFEKYTVSRSDCGATNPTASFTLVD